MNEVSHVLPVPIKSPGVKGTLPFGRLDNRSHIDIPLSSFNLGVKLIWGHFGHLGPAMHSFQGRLS